MVKERPALKHQDIIAKMTLEEKCCLFSGKDFWRTRAVERLGIVNMSLSDGPHGVRKQKGAGDQLPLRPGRGRGHAPGHCGGDQSIRQAGRKLQTHL